MSSSNADRARSGGSARLLMVFACLSWLVACIEVSSSDQATIERAGEGGVNFEGPLLAPDDERVDTDGGARQPASSANQGVAEGGPGDALAFLAEVPDAPLREVLLSAPIVTAEKGRGGRSLGFKTTLQGGQKAYFKPEQTFSAANWYAEVAAYHLDRMLGLGRVPCVTSRQFVWSELEAAAGKDARKSEVIVVDGKVRGALIAWIQGSLMPLPETPGWERWVRVRHWPSTAVSPFQRPAVWKQQLLAQKRMGNDFRSKEDRQRLRMLNPEPDRDDRPAELSDLIVFDYLTKNGDRWGGGNVNVLIRGERGPLIFLDNGAGFEPGDHRPSLMEARLRTMQRFRRSTIRALRALDIARYRARLLSEPVQPVLSENQLQGLIDRRAALLSWVDELERTQGEAIWGWE